MEIITMNTNGQTQPFGGGTHQVITRLKGGTATLKVRFQGSTEDFEDYVGGVLVNGSDILEFSDCELELTKTGNASVEFVRIGF